jgi:hypothetical protein
MEVGIDVCSTYMLKFVTMAGEKKKLRSIAAEENHVI